METAKQFIGKVNSEIVNPLVVLLLAAALLYFLWGLAQFIWNSDNDDAREKGRRHMIWGIVGLFIMVSVFGIINLLLGTFGLGSVTPTP